MLFAKQSNLQKMIERRAGKTCNSITFQKRMLLLGFLLKVMLFSLAVGILPIASTLAEHRVDGGVPVSMLSGVARLFLALALIETAFLAVKYV